MSQVWVQIKNCAAPLFCTVTLKTDVAMSTLTSNYFPSPSLATYIGGDSCVCLGQQQMNYPFSSLPSLPLSSSLTLLPFPSLPPLSLPSLSPASGSRAPGVWGPGVLPPEIFWIIIRGLVHSGVILQQIGGSVQVCNTEIYVGPKRICLITTERINNNNEHRRSWGSILYALLRQYRQPRTAIAAPAVWVSPPMAACVKYRSKGKVLQKEMTEINRI